MTAARSAMAAEPEALRATAGESAARELALRLEPLHEASFAWAITCSAGRREEAEDVLQTAYQKILDGRARFDGHSRLKTWMFAIVWRTAADLRRRRAWRRALLGSWAREAATRVASSEPADRRLAESERAQRVRQALEALSERQRQVLELVFYHDQTIREAAEVLGLKLGTARVHYQRGKAALAARLESEVRDD